ncbi:MAG: ATP synthase F1 subunit gamma [Candidatus Gracilibacteria bacterium]|nr:ATP synthase F1 subunit gamma [Candidatus Gracilibacteria bacterium]
MANAKEIKRRISSIKNTAKITKAMELISTVKMKKAQDAATSKKAFMAEAMKVFLRIGDSLNDYAFFKQGSGDKTLGVMITSNKGLCGGYNVNTMKKVNSYRKETGEEMDYVTIGKRGALFVARTGNNIVADYSDDYSDNITPVFSKNVSDLVIEKFMSGEYKKVVIFYTHFVNTISQVPVARTFLEISKDDIFAYFKQVLGEDKYEDLAKEIEGESNEVYEFEPSKEEIAKQIVPMILEMMLYDILLQAKASEHSQRMVAMKAAKDNANSFAGKLTLAYNKARQAAITAEVSEIVSGVEAMKDA